MSSEDEKVNLRGWSWITLVAVLLSAAAVVFVLGSVFDFW